MQLVSVYCLSLGSSVGQEHHRHRPVRQDGRDALQAGQVVQGAKDREALLGHSQRDTGASRGSVLLLRVRCIMSRMRKPLVKIRTTYPMRLHHVVGGSTGPRCSLIRFDLQENKFTWLKLHIIVA